MLKQIKALGLVLLVGGMLVGCEEAKGIENINLKGAGEAIEQQVEEEVSNEEVSKIILVMADELLNSVDFVQAYINDNQGMDINQYASYVADRGIESIMVGLEENGIEYNIQLEDVKNIAWQYMYEDVYNKLQQAEYKINQGMINNKFEELEKEQQELIPDIEEVDEAQWEEDMYNKLVEVANNEFGQCYINREDLGNNGIEVYARIYADPEFVNEIGYLKIDANGNIVYIEKF